MIRCKCDDKKRKCITCCDNPNNFNELSIEEQEILISWIENNIIERTKFITDSKSSYGIKGIFEGSDDGFYINNGQFKGAMVKLGFKHNQGVNWNFNISKSTYKKLEAQINL